MTTSIYSPMSLANWLIDISILLARFDNNPSTHYLRRLLRVISGIKVFEPERYKKGFDTHHIIPRCCGGTDDQINLLIVTRREHYVVHHLFAKAFPKNIKAYFAFYSNFQKPYGSLRRLSKYLEHIAFQKKVSLINKKMGWGVNGALNVLPKVSQPNVVEKRKNMNNGNHNQQIPISQVEEYRSNGWEFGYLTKEKLILNRQRLIDEGL